MWQPADLEDGARTGPVLFPLLPFLSGRHGKEPKLHPGMRIRYFVPSTIRPSTRNVPPWDSTMCLAMESGSPEFAGPRLVDPVEPLDRKSFFARRGREGDSPLPAVFFLAETALPTPLAESAPILRVPRPTRHLPAPYRRQHTCLDTGGNPASPPHGQRYPGAPDRESSGLRHLYRVFRCCRTVYSFLRRIFNNSKVFLFASFGDCLEAFAASSND